ncbi:MAG: D-alanyl-D-alanine carboxypeptidase/D-alanyl-D-alanine-endopeptidase [Cocleimonas sp.]|nr:D-alanyl-D-alanine carboxypeptidase/D-alanyl-D-alanine-endopeptidase [Cocleimonas sp.]
MNYYNIKVIIITIFLLVAGVVPSVNAQQPPIYNNLPPEVRNILNKSRISSHGMSAYVHAVGSPRPLLAYKENVPRSPASVMKLLTAHVALGVLGPHHRWPVDIFTTGNIQGGRLVGDVYIKGYGAPDFGTRDLRSLLSQLRKQRGIHSIQGRLVFDNSFFNTLNLNPGAFDGKPYSAYNAQPDALLYNERITHFSVSAKGKRVSVRAKTPAYNLHVVNKMRKVRRGCRPRISISKKGGKVTATFRGTFSSRCGVRRYSRVLMNPANTLYSAIKNIWKNDLKGNIRVKFATGRTPPHAKKLATLSSKNLAQILPKLGKDSNNVIARQLMLAIGAKRYGAPGTPRKGAEAIGEFLNKRGLHFPELRIENGSGLSRQARISAKHISDLLMDAYRSPHRHLFMQSLSIAGVDGTMKRRLRHTPVKGRGFFKTGTLRNVRGVAGYVKAADGKTYMVSILHNDPKASSRGKKSHDGLIKWVFWGGKQQNIATGY